MLQCVSNLSGLVVVADVWEAPCLPLLQLISKQKPVSSLFFSLESPVFRIGEVGCPVVDLYGKEVEFPELSRDVSLVIVDGVSDWLSQKGVAVVLRALFRLLQVHGCVVVSVHADLVDQPTLSALFAAASSVFSISASNRVFTLSKRKGGKVVRATEDVIDWKGPQLKPVDVKVRAKNKKRILRFLTCS
jgi:hypothetical protein